MDKNFFGKILSGLGSFWSDNRSVVGIDIGSSSLKVAQLRKEKERPVLETYGELAVGPYSNSPVGQVAQLSEEMATEALKNLMAEAGVTAKKAVISIPLRSSFLTVFKVPMAEGKAAEQIIKMEARKYIPAPLNEVEMNWQVLGPIEKEDEVKDKMPIAEILLVAIYKEVIQKYQNILQKAGFKERSFEIEIFSIWRSSLFRPTAPVMLIDLGAATTKMSIIDGGLLKSSFTIDQGSQSITRAISRSLNITFERAEEMKIQLGLSSKPEYKELNNVIESAFSIIFGEAKHFMNNYRRKYNESVSQVVLSGGGALIEGGVDMAVKNLGVEVALSNPFLKTQYPAFLEDTLKQIGPMFSPVIGLALKEL